MSLLVQDAIIGGGQNELEERRAARRCSSVTPAKDVRCRYRAGVVASEGIEGRRLESRGKSCFKETKRADGSLRQTTCRMTTQPHAGRLAVQ